MAKRSSLRASDADRERVAERLRQAATEGRILAQELEDRLATALRAKTYGELDEVVWDLPGAPLSPRDASGSHSRQLLPAQPLAAVALLVAVTMMMFVLAAVVIAGVFAFSGVWVLFMVLMLIHRSGRSGGRPPRGRHVGGRHQYRL